SPPPLLSERRIRSAANPALHRDLHAQPEIARRAPSATESRSAPAVASPQVTSNSSEIHPEIAQQLNSIRAMVEKLSRAPQSGAGSEVPQDLFHVYTGLIDAEVEDDLARELVFRLKRECAPER